MSDYCVVVADGARARLFTLERAEIPELESSPNLVERQDLANPEKELPDREIYASAKTGRNRAPGGGPAHGYDDHRANHNDENDRRFVRALAEQAAHLVQDNQVKSVVLVAQNRVLGMLRDACGPLVKSGVAITELAKDVTKLSAIEIHEILAKESLLPRRKKPGG